MLYRARIEELWRAKGAGSSKWMYNGTKFRLADYIPTVKDASNSSDNSNSTSSNSSSKNSSNSSSNRNLLLQVGMTDYKDLQGTNVADYSSELVDLGSTGGKRFRR